MDMLRNWKLPFVKSPEECNGLVLGVDSGKTTLLSALCGTPKKLAIPTIGFNVNTVRARDGSGWECTLWDVGGGCVPSQYYNHFCLGKEFCLFLHDISGSLEYSEEDSYYRFGKVLEPFADAGGKFVWVLFTKQDLLEPDKCTEKLELATKKFQEIARPLQDKIQVRVWHMPGFNPLTGNRTDEMLTEVRKVLQQQGKGGKAAKKVGNSTKDAVAGFMSEGDLKFALEEANIRIQRLSADDFWKQFLDGNLDSWDHASHLRAGLGVILDGYLKPRGLFAWTDDFIAHLARLRNGRPDLFRNTAHRTMTMFWLYQIHRALKMHMASQSIAGDEISLPGLDVFADLLKVDPNLLNKNVWRQFYSQELMFTPEAKEGWCLPDLAMLPDTVASPSRKGQAGVSSSSSDLRLPRFAFTVVKTVMISNVRRGAVIKHALVALQRTTMQKQTASSEGPAPPPYSETKAYFWIQYIHACLKVFEKGSLSKQTENLSLYRKAAAFSDEEFGQVLSFPAFQAMFSLRGDEWKQFYSAKTWESMAARSQMVLPDRKQLPNVFAAPGSQATSRAKNVLVLDTFRTVGNIAGGVPSTVLDATDEELNLYAELVAEEATKNSKADKNDETEALDDVNDNKTLVGDNAPRSRVVARAELLTFIFNGLSSINRKSRTELSKASMRLTSDMITDSKLADGATQSYFWVQLVLSHYLSDPETAPTSFVEFIRRHPILALDDIPSSYYSPEVWESAEAKATFVMPDRKALPSMQTAE